ncbi:MAG: hypothetical protein AAGB26_04375 [Planctomycetota bacterium]
MPDESVIEFECPACGKSYRVSAAMAGKSAKCKQCGGRMRVPDARVEPEPSAETDDFIPLVADDDDASRAKPTPLHKSADTAPVKKSKAESNDPWNLENDSADANTLGVDPWASKEEEPIGHLEALAPPEGDSEMKPTTFQTQAAYKPQREKPSGLASAIGTGLLDNMAAMWNAMVNPTKGGRAIPRGRRISLGGCFLLISGLVLFFFAFIYRSSRSYIPSSEIPEWAMQSTRMVPMKVLAMAACIAGLLVIVWRCWSPREEEEVKLVTVVFWGVLGLVGVSTVLTLVGGADATVIMSHVGSIGLLLAAAAFGAWVYLRLTQDGDGSMALLLIVPAIIIPATQLIVQMANTPRDMINQIAWDMVILQAFLAFLALVLMGGAISFWILIALPLELLGVGERPEMPMDVEGGAGNTAMIVIFGFCGLCYLMLVVSRWRMMLKPVAWQFVILIFGVSLMAHLQVLGLNAQGKQDAIAEQEQRSHETEERTFDFSTENHSAVDSDPSEPVESTGPDPTIGDFIPDPFFHPSNGPADTKRVELLKNARIESGPNRHGRPQPGTRVSWEPYPHSPTVFLFGHTRRDSRVLYFPSGGAEVNPDVDTLMDFGFIEDTRTQPVLMETPRFEVDELSPGLLGSPFTWYAEPDESWPVFEAPPIDMGSAVTHSIFGYAIDLLPGYEVVVIQEDPASGVRTAVIDSVDAVEPGRYPKIRLHLAPVTIENFRTTSEGWFNLAKEVVRKNPRSTHRHTFGRIHGEPFARCAPRWDRPQNYLTEILYVSTSIKYPMRIAISISSSMQSRESVLRCEAMARSLRRPVKAEAAMPEQGIPDNGNMWIGEKELRQGGWIVSGIFALRDDSTRRLSRGYTPFHEGGIRMNWGEPGRRIAGIFIDMKPLPIGTSRDERVLAGGARMRRTVDRDAFDLLADPFVVNSYGAPVTYERLWNGELFARVEHQRKIVHEGDDGIDRVSLHRFIEYSGFLGDYWTVVRLIDDGERGQLSLDMLEDALRSSRLLSPSRVAVVPAMRANYLPYILENESGMLPLAGGLTIAEAFTLDVRGQAMLKPGLPEAVARGEEAATSSFIVDMPVPEGYEPWTISDQVDKYLGDTESFGRFRFQPLKDLRASAKNSDRYAEWFARTDSGKVGMTLKFEKLLEGQAAIKVPLTTDPATGEFMLELGRRKLRPQSKPDVTYRDGNGLRIWRVLMPQAGGASVRRCYYLVALTDGHLVIAADFERDKALQLQAMDASVASLVDSQPPKDE